jgi:ABC-type Fe3+/spermidine/putrescine transport system ATPase subunit
LSSEPYLQVEGLQKTFGSVAAVRNVSFSAASGELLTLLGPSGCGKTTILRCLAGLEMPEEGKITIGGKVVTSIKENIYLPPEKRKLGIVFQSYAVWPHMTVFENIAYGLVERKIPKPEIQKKVEEAQKLVGLEGLGDRYATELSGGQQQRVGLARAIVYEPSMLLLDEPLSNLDAKLREQMRFYIRDVQKKLGTTTVYVTHDQSEAMVISDKIIVMDRGEIMQIGSATELYERPNNEFIANFIGTANLLRGRIRAYLDDRYCHVDVPELRGTLQCQVSEHLKEGDDVIVSVRPERITFGGTKKNPNVLEGRITKKAYLGNIIDYWVSVETREIRLSSLSDFKVGDHVSIEMLPSACTLIPADARK